MCHDETHCRACGFHEKGTRILFPFLFGTFKQSIPYYVLSDISKRCTSWNSPRFEKTGKVSRPDVILLNAFWGTQSHVARIRKEPAKYGIHFRCLHWPGDPFVRIFVFHVCYKFSRVTNLWSLGQTTRTEYIS